ncbi:hypothetical protein C8Q70DRAFT_991214 [Cubamyces menziesii]|nr:hypothetical protein C8Q70DRAFT_991214 [Cubamyces menziesii]
MDMYEHLKPKDRQDPLQDEAEDCGCVTRGSIGDQSTVREFEEPQRILDLPYPQTTHPNAPQTSSPKREEKENVPPYSLKHDDGQAQAQVVAPLVLVSRKRKRSLVNHDSEHLQHASASKQTTSTEPTLDAVDPPTKKVRSRRTNDELQHERPRTYETQCRLDGGCTQPLVSTEKGRREHLRAAHYAYARLEGQGLSSPSSESATAVTARLVCSYGDPRCGKDFATLGDLVRHVESVHWKQTFECKSCGREYTCRASLKRHKDTTSCHANGKLNAARKNISSR